MTSAHPLLQTLEQTYAQALTRFTLGQKVLVGAHPGASHLQTANDLYQFQLLDNQVQAKVPTSEVAECISSLQQYLHGIYLGSEPGYPALFDEEEVEYWRNWFSRYGVWAANELLQYYPENYLDPALRLNKTELFNHFEQTINQSRISDKTIRQALLGFLQTFSQLCNLTVLSGYIDGATRHDADYYLIGREKVEPFGYYWRKARIDIVPNSVRVNPTAWGEWQAVGVKLEANVSHVQPVVFGGRLFLCWVERRELPKPDDTQVMHWRYEVYLSYLDLNQTWALPNKVFDLPEAGDPSSYSFLAVAFDNFADGGATLAVAFGSSSENCDAVVWNLVMDRQLLTQEHNQKLHDLAARLFGEKGSLQQRLPNLQVPIEGTQYTYEVASIRQNPGPIDGQNPHVPQGGINASLDMQAVVASDRNILMMPIRGVCSAGREVYGLERVLIRPDQLPAHTTLEIEIVRGTGKGSVIVNLGVGVWGGEMYLHHDSVLVYTGQVTAQQNRFTFELSDALEQAILGYEHARDGAGFTVRYRVDFNLRGTANLLVRRANSTERPRMYLWERKQPNQSMERLWDGPIALNGVTNYTPTIVYSKTIEADFPLLHTFAFGVDRSDGEHYGYSWFDVQLRAKPEHMPRIVTTAEGAQFLDINDPDYTLKYVRLNSLFSQHLIQRLAVSLDRLLHWDTQHLPEPGTPDAPSVPVPMDFDGANGRYLWELFFHVPHLVAQRLREEQSHAQAQRWFHYLFNPGATGVDDAVGSNNYWQCRPLLLPGSPSHENQAPTDPDAIAYSTPEHYRKAIFMAYVHNLIEWGDRFYRRLTRDDLSEAKLLYVRALDLMGNKPEFRGASRWAPVVLEELLASDYSALADEEAKVLALLAGQDARSEARPWTGMLASPAFHPPLNQILLDVWDLLASRLDNMRAYLTLDGRPMSLALYAPVVDPRQLLLAQQNGAGFGQRNPGGHIVIPPYRFLAVLDRVQHAVDVLIRFGEQLRQLMEQGDRAQQEELIQQHLVEMSAFATQLQEEGIAQAEATRQALVANQGSIRLRRDHYARLIESGLTRREEDAQALRISAGAFRLASSAAETVGHFADLFPNVFGLANGGHKFSGGPFAVAAGYSAVATALEMSTQILDVGQFRMERERDWTLQRDLAELELEALEAQIEAQQVQIRAARIAHEQQLRARSQAEEVYTFLNSTRRTHSGLYRWLLGQMSTLYYQAYDTVTASCIALEASWQYEIGDYQTFFIQPNVWFDNYHGLTAGESLKLAVMKMESAFLRRHERRQEITRSLSLRQLLGEQSWPDALATLARDGSLPFALTSRMLDEDYPGLYLRQLLRVSVTLPVVLGPYQEVKLRLQQVVSKVVIRPEIGAVRYTHDPADPLAQSTAVKFNLRPSAQISVSSGIDDAGLVMNFDDGRYLPFEGTGADSQWLIEFPNHARAEQQAVIASLTDIIVQFAYHGVDGGKQFSDEVLGLLYPHAKAGREEHEAGE